MASKTPDFIHNENIPIHRGKPSGDKASLSKAKPPKSGLQERKALRDLSNAKSMVLGPSKAASNLKEKSAVKEKPGLNGRGTVAKTAPKGSILTDDQIEKCREWAKDGIEQAHFTGNDTQKLQKEREEERVRKEVEMVMSAMREWTKKAYDLGMPKVAKDTEDIMKLELVPEVLPPTINSRSKSGKEEIEDLLEAELDTFPFLDSSFELKLKDDYD